MYEDALKWDARYREDFMPNIPSVFIRHAINTIKICVDSKMPKHSSTQLYALDLACGNGRHTKLLAKLGYQVDALDISSVALQNLNNLPFITPILADLDTYTLPYARYNLVLNSFFLDRRLFEAIIHSLQAHSFIIFETFIDISSTQQNLQQKALYPGELERVFNQDKGFIPLYNKVIPKTTPSPYTHIQRFIAQYRPI